MSSRSTPTDLFQDLSLNPSMNVTIEEVRARATEVRDVLSSFDREILPSEYRPDIFANIDRPASSRLQSQSEWTLQEDLLATLMQWGAYDEDAWNVIVKLQDPSTRTRCFQEKLKRRFGDIFGDYDLLNGTTASSHKALEAVEELAKRFTTVVQAIQEDQKYRDMGQERTARLSLDALLGVCKRHKDVTLSSLTSPETSRGESSSTLPPRSNVSLFQVLVRDSGETSTGATDMLDLLEAYPHFTIGNLKYWFIELVDLLNTHGAPSSFVRRAMQLLEIAEAHEQPSSPAMDSPGVDLSAAPAAATTATTTPVPAQEDHQRDPSPPASSIRTRSYTRIEPKAGSKRSAAVPAATQGTSKRGKKKPTKF